LKECYTVKEMHYVLEQYEFKKSEMKAVSWFIQTLINHDFEKEPAQ